MAPLASVAWHDQGMLVQPGEQRGDALTADALKAMIDCMVSSPISPEEQAAAVQKLRQETWEKAAELLNEVQDPSRAADNASLAERVRAKLAALQRGEPPRIAPLAGQEH